MILISWLVATFNHRRRCIIFNIFIYFPSFIQLVPKKTIVHYRKRWQIFNWLVRDSERCHRMLPYKINITLRGEYKYVFGAPLLFRYPVQSVYKRKMTVFWRAIRSRTKRQSRVQTRGGSSTPPRSHLIISTARVTP